MSDTLNTDHHVLVVGSGLAGLLSAVFAARNGLKVRLLYRGQGALGIGGGTIDVLGYAPGMDKALVRPLDGLAALPPEHPYTLAGRDAILNALNAFLELTAAMGFTHVQRTEDGQPVNTLVLTAAGTAKPACIVPPSMTMSGFDPDSTAGEVVIVGFEGLKDMYPRLMAQGFAGMKRLHGRRIIPLTLTGPEKLCLRNAPPQPRLRDLSSLDLARFMDSPDGVPWLADRLRTACTPNRDTVVLLPPILGTAPRSGVHAALESALGCRVHEVPAPPPAVTGLRLRTALFAELNRLGVDITANAQITGYEHEGSRCTALVSSVAGRPRHWTADNFIIATGGVYGEGLLVRPDAVTDVIFPETALTPDVTPQSADWSASTAYPSLCAGEIMHGFARLGARVNDRFQPLGADGSALFDNVFYAGRAVGGYDHAAEKSGNGVALLTAWLAASRLASRRA